MKKRFTRDVVAGRAKFRMLTFYCHYFHSLIPETNEQTGFFLLRMLLEKLGSQTILGYNSLESRSLESEGGAHIQSVP